MDQFIKKNEIKAIDMFNSTTSYLVKKFNQARQMFSYSTAYGQILLVLQNHFQLILYYIQDSISESYINRATRINNIYGLAALAGHDAQRTRTAVGEISLSPKSSSINLKGDSVIIPNLTRIKCTNNNLTYIIHLSKDEKLININNTRTTNFKIVEGKFDYQILYGTGEDIQSINLNIELGKMVDNDIFSIEVNGNKAYKYDSIYDIPYGVLGYIVRNSNNGISFIFGNSLQHKIPQDGEEIRIDYLMSSGVAGNIHQSENLLFTFIDSGIDINGNDVDLNDIFNITCTLPPSLGANMESPELTKVLVQSFSRNLTIHDRESLEYHIRKLNYFANVKVFKVLNQTTKTTNEFSVLLFPNIKNKLITDDYFSMPLENFIISESEITRLNEYFDESGIKSTNLVISYIKPKIKRYSVTIQIDAYRSFKGITVTKELIKEKIKEVLADYMINNTRYNKIPNSDIVKNLTEKIDYIDAVKVIFKSEDGNGLDKMGNINVPYDQIAVIRGGWTDTTSNVYYEDSFNIENDKPCAVNCYINFINEIFI
jgi:hypothetical protein